MTVVKASTANSATAAAPVTAGEIAAALAAVNVAKAALASAEAALAAGAAFDVDGGGTTDADEAAGTAQVMQSLANTVAQEKVDLALAEAAYAATAGVTAVAEGKAGDMTAYSGYQADVTLSTETDSGIKFSMGFDLEAGLMADKDDDLEMDTKSGSIANSTLTMEANGYTLVIGQDEIDDLYDDSQNGDISLSGDMNGLSFTVVHDFEDSVLAKAATYTAASGTLGAADYKVATFSDAVAKDHNGSSVKLGYTMGNATLGLVATSADDDNNSANKVTLGYTVSDTLSFSVAQDSKGKAAAITSASVTYAIDALTITASYADDKNHAGNTNKNGKASTDLKVAYTQGPISATFATNESSQWEVITSYDLGGGAAAFATVDHSEFAVAGLSFAF